MARNQSELSAAMAESAELSTDAPLKVQGWALKKGKKSTRFSKGMRSFLYDVFFQGEEAGIKAIAADVLSKMKRV